MKTALNTLLLATVATSAFLSSSAAPVQYIDEDGNPLTSTHYIVVTSSLSDYSSFSVGEFVVTNDVAFGEPLRFSGFVRLILCDGATLAVATSRQGEKAIVPITPPPAR